jgi:hypothetical protein
MVGVSGDLLSGLPGELQRLLARPPVTEKKLLELSVAWAGLTPGQARTADAVRLFVITWDPLECIAPRPDGFATVNIGSPGLELVVYAPCWLLIELAAEREGTIAGVLGAMSGSAVVTAGAHEQSTMSGSYPDLVIQGLVPDLLSDVSAGAALGPPDIRLVSPGWEDIGLGAMTDIVRHAFGSVEFDRSPVELAAAPEPRVGCPACAGRRFDFPADLAEARDGMCSDHRRETEKVINRRLSRANASNPDGWGALTDASLRLERPHLPNGLATKLASAEEAMYVIPEPEELAERAKLVIEAANWFPGRPDELASALGQEPDAAGQLPDWLVNLVLDLGRAGLGAEAAALGAALTRVDPDRHSFFDCDVAVALAEAGLADEARARIAANLARWPNDFWVRVHAGDALAALCDIDGAEAHFSTALGMAEDADDFEARYDAVERLRQVRRSTTRNEADPPRGQRRQPRRLSKSQRKRSAHHKR